MEISNHLLEYILLIVTVEMIGWWIGFHGHMDVIENIRIRARAKVLARRMAFSIPIAVVAPNNPEGIIAIISVLVVSLMFPTLVAAGLLYNRSPAIDYIERMLTILLATGAMLLWASTLIGLYSNPILKSLPLLIITVGITFTLVLATSKEIIKRYVRLMELSDQYREMNSKW